MRKKEQIIEAFEKRDGKRKLVKGGQLPELDKHLTAFIVDCYTKKLPVNELLLKDKADDF